MHILKQSIISCGDVGPTTTRRVRRCWSNIPLSSAVQGSAMGMLDQHGITYSENVGPTFLKVSNMFALTARMLDQQPLTVSEDVGPTSLKVSKFSLSLRECWTNITSPRLKMLDQHPVKLGHVKIGCENVGPTSWRVSDFSRTLRQCWTNTDSPRPKMLVQHFLKQDLANIGCANVGPTLAHRIRKCWSNISSSKTLQTSAMQMLDQHWLTASENVGPTFPQARPCKHRLCKCWTNIASPILRLLVQHPWS